jgi:hypothetical protein
MFSSLRVLRAQDRDVGADKEDARGGSKTTMAVAVDYGAQTPPLVATDGPGRPKLAIDLALFKQM